MGYHRMAAEQLGAIWVRLNVGDSHRGIAERLGLDKKTVNQYAANIPPGTVLAQALPILDGRMGTGKRVPPWPPSIHIVKRSAP